MNLRSLMTVFLLLLSLSSTAKEPAILGFVMNFDCPHCKDVWAARRSLESHCAGGLKSDLCIVNYIPFMNELADFRPTAYFAIRETSLNLANEAADVFYDYDPKGPLSKDECLTLLTTLVPNHDWDKVFSETAISKGKAALSRAATIFKKLKISDYPTFVWITSDDARLVPTVHDPRKRLNSVIEFLGKQE